MMLLLVANVAIDSFKLRLANGEHGVAFLPTKSGAIRDRLVNPSRRMSFQVPHQHGNRFVRTPADQKMHMIGHSVDLMSYAALAADNAAKVFVNARCDGGLQPGRALFRRENSVVKEFRVGARHRVHSYAPSGLEVLRGDLLPRAGARGYRPAPLRGLRFSGATSYYGLALCNSKSRNDRDPEGRRRVAAGDSP